MSLVAYYSASSDEGSDDEMDTGEPAAAVTSIITPGPSISKSETPSSSGASKGAFQKFSKFDDDSDEEAGNVGGAGTSLKFDILPKPLEVNEAIGEIEDLVEEGPIPPKKVYDGQMEEKPPEKPSLFSGFGGLKTQKLGGRIQISAPSLKDFDDEEVSEKKGKVVQPGKKGSGLFSILPPPKHESVKTFSFTKKETTATATSTTESDVFNESLTVPRPAKAKSLIPDAVRQNMLGKRPTPSKLEEIKSKYLKQEANVRIVSRNSEKQEKHSDSEEEDESDFFSFAKASEPIPDDPSLRLPDYVPPEPEDVQMTTSEEANYSYVEQPGTSAVIDPAQFIRKGKKKNEPVNFIDVKADDLRPDNIEWMRNLTSEEAPPPSRPKNAPGGMVKRKHQITYLAFEAKAREQALKNQWSQNNHNKRVTQSKYGF